MFEDIRKKNFNFGALDTLKLTTTLIYGLYLRTPKRLAVKLIFAFHQSLIGNQKEVLDWDDVLQIGMSGSSCC
jgi:hypothetical protein